MGNLQLFAKIQSADQSRAAQPTTQYVRLDTAEAEPIKVTASVQSFEDPTRVSSVFSRTFKLPHTAVNGPFFKAAFSVNGTDFNITQKADAYILFNGVDFANGYIRLVGITGNLQDNNYEYEVTFYGQTADFGTKVGGGFLNELNLSSLNHTPTYQNIRNSWTVNPGTGLMNGNVLYGLVEWGYTYNQDNVPSINTLSHDFDNTTSGSFTNPNYPLLLEQFKPSLRVKAIWDAIFNEAGFSYTSDFLGTNVTSLQSTYQGSSRFKNLYIITESQARVKLDQSALFKANNPGKIVSVQAGDEGYWQPIPETNANCTTEIYDYQDAYNKTFGECYYTAQTTYTTHKFAVYGKASFSRNDDVDPTLFTFTIRIKNYDTGVVLATAKKTEYGTMAQNVIINTTLTVSLVAGQRVYMTVEAEFDTPDHYTQITNLSWSCIEAGANFNIASLMPDKIKKIDFLKSIINKFKLVFVPSKTVPNRFEITPWVDWIKKGSIVDWTNKIDISKDIIIKPLFDGQTRKVVFTEKDDTDYINDAYQRSNGNRVFGNLILDSDNEMLTGDTNYSTEFSPIQIGPIGYKDSDTLSTTFIVPHVAKDSVGGEGAPGKREPIVPKMKIAYYNGKRSVPTGRTWYLSDQANGTGIAQPQTYYPVLSNYEDWPPSETSLDLNWNNEKPAWFDTIPLAQRSNYPWNTNQTVYELYWKDWYNMVYDPFSRSVECTVVLSYRDFLDLNFNDKIFIRDSWYFVDTVQDFVIGENSSCRVKLVKVGNAMNLAMDPTSPFTAVSLCRGTTACNAYCCCKYLECSTRGLYYVDGTTLANSLYIFADEYGGTFAPAGFYADSTSACYLGTDGQIVAFYYIGGCNCGGGGIPDEYTVKVGNSPCESLISGVPIKVYGEESTFADNTRLYLDSALTVTAPAGYYREVGDTADSVRIGDYGLNYAIYPLADCPSNTYYNFNAKFSATECDSCCSTKYSAIYIPETEFTNASVVYGDNAGDSLAGIGYYAVGDDIMYVDPSGTPASFSVCSGCPDCPDGTVSVNVCVFQDLDGYRTIGELYTSADGTTWVSRGYVEVTTTDPSGTPTCSEFLLDAGLYCKVVFGTDEPGGTMTVTIDEDGIVTYLDETSTPGSYELVFPTRLIDGINYYATGSVDGGSVVTPTYYQLSLWYEKNLSNPCRPYCHIDMIAGTYYGDNYTLATSTYIYTDNLGTTPADPGWYSDGTVISQVGSNGLLIAGANPNDCDCGPEETKLFPFEALYDASVGCDACCSGTAATVYGLSEVITDNKVFYQYGPSGIEPATAGFYSINGWYAELDVNGVVISTGRCVDDCSCTTYYARYYITNRTREAIKYSYTGQDTVYYYGTIESGKYILTECMDLSTLELSGYCDVVEESSCMP